MRGEWHDGERWEFQAIPPRTKAEAAASACLRFNFKIYHALTELGQQSPCKDCDTHRRQLQQQQPVNLRPVNGRAPTAKAITMARVAWQPKFYVSRANTHAHKLTHLKLVHDHLDTLLSCYNSCTSPAHILLVTSSLAKLYQNSLTIWGLSLSLMYMQYGYLSSSPLS